jgi:hypothetical protein
MNDSVEVEALARAMFEFGSAVFDHDVIREHAETFSSNRFRSRMRTHVEMTLTGSTP